MRVVVKTNLPAVISSLKEKIETLQPGGANYDALIREVATTSLSALRRRIHEEGKAADGSDIGKYSRKPLYVSASANPGKSFGRPIGKAGRSKFETGKRAGHDHKSRYFPDGYEGFKNQIGRNTINKVNLFLSGTLMNQFQILATGNGYGLGWSDAERLTIAKAMETKYGKKIYNLTDEEKTEAVKVGENYLKRALS